MLESAYLATAVSLHLVDLRLEVGEHLLVDFLVGHVDDFARDILLGELAVLIGKSYFGLSHILDITAGIDAKNLTTILVGNPLIMNLMVVSEEDNVEAWNLLGYSLCGILFIVGCLDAAIESGVEKTEEQVGLLDILNILHPLTGALHHILELHTFPDGVVEPVGNGGGKHAQHHNLDAIDLMNGIRLQSVVDMLGMSLSILEFFLHDVGTQKGATHFANPLVVNLMARLDIVITHSLGIILHIVDDLSSKVLILGHDIIGPIYTGLTLQNVAIVDE